MSELHGGSAVAKPTCQIVPPAMLGYRRFCGFTVDPDRSGAWTGPDLAKARNLIAASGTRGERVVVWTYRTFRKEGHYFATLLGRLGYRAQLKDLDDPGTYYPALDRTPAVQAGLFGVFQTKVPTDMFTWLRCDYAGNWARFCDPRIEAQVRRLAAVEASDPAAGAALAARIDREIVAKAPWVPLFTPRLADFVSARVGNFQANTYASGTILLDQLWVR